MKTNQVNKQLVDFIVWSAKEKLMPERIILFGSRARGDAREHSDYDIAFELPPGITNNEWAGFCADVNENAPTLLSLDLVNINTIDDSFKEKIHKEGIVLYEQA